MDSKIVKVKILDKNLQKHNGLFMRVGIDKAIRGESTGIWIIVDDENENVYENKSLSSEDYHTKKKIGHSKLSLGRKDLFR